MSTDCLIMDEQEPIDLDRESDVEEKKEPAVGDKRKADIWHNFDVIRDEKTQKIIRSICKFCSGPLKAVPVPTVPVPVPKIRELLLAVPVPKTKEPAVPVLGKRGKYLPMLIPSPKHSLRPCELWLEVLPLSYFLIVYLKEQEQHIMIFTSLFKSGNFIPQLHIMVFL
ncbi:hypothetical protein LXL04_019198 [Taraxacum kok-saghyz]